MSNLEKIEWNEENVQFLLNNPIELVQQRWPYHGIESLKAAQRRQRAKLLKAIPEGERIIDNEAEKALHNELSKAIKQYNIDPRNIQGFKVTSGFHQGYIKNSENEIEYTDDLERRGVTLHVKARDFEPKWPVIQRVPYIVDGLPTVKEKKTTERKVAVILPDPQIGFLQYQDGSIEPFHDYNAISVAFQIINDLQPDKVICLGDFLDLPMFGTYEQSPEFARTAQLAVNYGYKFLAQIRGMVPNAEIAVLEGNHDKRMEKSLKNNAMSAFGLRKANQLENWPVLSVPYLCAFDELDVTYVEGYPAGKYWINERLQLIHGHVVRSNGSTAAAVAKTENVSTIFGHVHRIESHYDTQNIYQGGRTNAAFTPGCLCRIDGAVPSAKGSNDLRGRPIRSYENWQQGVGIVSYREGDKPFSYQQVYINSIEGHETEYNGKIYFANPKLVQ